MLTRLPTVSPGTRDAALLLARLAVGTLFVAHGWQKYRAGLDAVSAGFDRQGVPFPRLSAAYATGIELGGGVLLILGALTALAALLLTSVMAGAFVFVNAGKTPFVAEGGWELVLALGIALAFIAAAGAGRFSIDRLLTSPATSLSRLRNLVGPTSGARAAEERI